MQDILSYVAQINRPKLLVKAARIGSRSYDRERHLRSFLNSDSLPRTALCVLRLTEVEADLNNKRVAKDASYSVSRHVAVLSALIAEATTMQTTPALETTLKVIK